MRKRAGPRPRNNKKSGRADVRDEIQGQEKNELQDLAEGEGRVDGGGCRPAEHFDRVRGVVV